MLERKFARSRRKYKNCHLRINLNTLTLFSEGFTIRVILLNDNAGFKWFKEVFMLKYTNEVNFKFLRLRKKRHTENS